jgi:hypothetical protein
MITSVTVTLQSACCRQILEGLDTVKSEQVTGTNRELKDMIGFIHAVRGTGVQFPTEQSTHGADHSPPSGAEVQNVWSCFSFPRWSLVYRISG